MKKILLIGLAVLLSNRTNAQSSSATNIWAAGRYLGWQGNNALEFRTNNTNRIKLNGNLNYSINGLNGNRNGFMLLSNNPTATSWGIGYSPMATNNFGAFALLHLIGDDSPFVQEGEKIC